MRNFSVEFLGTFILVLTVIWSIHSSLSTIAPLLVGGVLTAIIYVGGPLSGAHYNPVVTMAFAINRKAHTYKIIGYIISQLLGAVAAVYVFRSFIFEGTITQVDQFNFLNGLMAEFVGTLALVWVILVTAKIGHRKGSKWYGLAIGVIVMVCAFLVGHISGGAFNPVVSLGFVFSKMASWSTLAIYFIGQITAAVMAAILFRTIYLKR